METPTYIVEQKDHDFEIRRYDRFILAQVDVESDFDGAVREGFSILPHYFFGSNKKRAHFPMGAPVSKEALPHSEKIPMAAPVTEEKAGANVYRISFTMPSNYTLDTCMNRRIRGSNSSRSRVTESLPSGSLDA